MDKAFAINVSDIDIAMKIEGAFKKTTMELNVDIDDENGEIIYVYKVVVKDETIESFNETLKNNGLEEYGHYEQSEPAFTEELPF